MRNSILLRVFNVGQADSLELLPPMKCDFQEKSILVDCGQGSRNVFSSISREQVVLILSHAHDDHIGGLSHLFSTNLSSSTPKTRIVQLWLPYYNDEIVKIANFILSLKGVSSILGKTREEIELRNMVDCYRFLRCLFDPKVKGEIKGLREGMKMCKHLSILNPPLDPDSALGLKKGDCRGYRDKQRRSEYDALRRWLTEEDFNRLWGSFIAEGWDYSVPNLIDNTELDWNSRMDFIYGFFCKYERIIDDFVRRSDSRHFARIANCIKLASNDISIVIRYEFGDFSCLLTGDVSKRQWKRCLPPQQKKRVSILKFPHHGSKSSLDRKLLLQLSPELTIVSHGNGCFGKQKDPHPNLEVIQALDDIKTNVAYTNDVKEWKSYQKEVDR